ncbi:DEGP2, partial [Symbiodinium microadriaticum]
MESHGLEVGTLSRDLDNNTSPTAEEPRETVYRDLLRQLDRIHTGQEAKIDELHHEKETLKAALVKLQREGYHAGRMASKESSMSSVALGLPAVTYTTSQTEGLGEVLAERAGSDAIPATTGDEKILAISHGLSEVDVLLEDEEEKPPRRIQLHPRWEENLSLSTARMTAGACLEDATNANDAVVKVFAAVSEPNYAVPWAYKPQDEVVPVWDVRRPRQSFKKVLKEGEDARTGTAFAVAWGKEGKQWLLTNAHVVRHAAVVQVRKRGDHQKFIATVLCVGLDCDLAVLTVSSAKFWEGLPRVVLSVELPKLQDEVTVVGCPIGGDNACVTVGVVSRIDMQRYNVCWSRSLLAIQIDAAINPGNSGGPCFHEESGSVECIGVAFQVLGRDDAENIGYIIPSEVVNHLLVDYVKHKSYTGFGSCGFTVQALENGPMRHALGLKNGETLSFDLGDGQIHILLRFGKTVEVGEHFQCMGRSGILVRRVDPSSSAGKVLKKGDIIRKVQGQDIGDDGKVPFRGARNERIDFHYLISKLFIGDTCSFQVLRDKHLHLGCLLVSSALCVCPVVASLLLLELRMKLSAVRPLVLHDPPDPPKYFVVGGLVFVPLSEPFLMDDFGADFHKQAPIGMIYHWAEGMRQFADHEIIVLSQVLASPLTVGFTDFYNVTLLKFNGQQPKNLEDLIHLVKASKDEYLTFEIERNNSIILP